MILRRCGRVLNNAEIEYVVALIMCLVKRQKMLFACCSLKNQPSEIVDKNL
jgi:hypothetical protein